MNFGKAIQEMLSDLIRMEYKSACWKETMLQKSLQIDF